MRLTNCFYWFGACLVGISLTACTPDDRLDEKNLPEIIRRDFSNRAPLAEILHFGYLPEELTQIDFRDAQHNPASAWYEGESWKMTHTKVNSISQLSAEAQHTFANSGYGDAHLLDIYKTEREGMEKSLYMLHFLYRRKQVSDLEHYVFINDDGLFLATFTWVPNDPCAMIRLSKDHFDFIAEKYKGAEIRGYINDGGRHEYFISHRDTVKYVFFGGEARADKGFWQKTTYELGKDTEVPEHVIRILNRLAPGFTYTNLYYKESEEGNAYLFKDKNRADELGYSIAEKSEATESGKGGD